MEVIEHVAKADFKKLVLQTEAGTVAKSLLNKIGRSGYVKIVKNMVRTGKEKAPESWPEEMKSVAEGTSRAAIEAREQYGAKKLAQLHGALQFCRCVLGQKGEIGSVYVAWICPHCFRIPVRDYIWFQCEGNFPGNRWFCSACGKQFKYGPDGFVLGVQTTDDPADLTWYSCEPPEGLEQNFIDYLKYATALFNGNFDPSAYAKASTAEAILRCLVQLIENDNEGFKFVMLDPRIVFEHCYIVDPIQPTNHKFYVQNDQITLQQVEVGRREPYYNLSKLPIWGPSSQKKVLRGEWGPIINILWSTLESAQALAFIKIPNCQYERPNTKRTDCAKRLCALAEASHIRTSGTWCNEVEATDSVKKWAEITWPFPATRKLEGAKGLLAICDGTMPGLEPTQGPVALAPA